MCVCVYVCVCVCLRSERNSVITMQSKLRVKIASHFWKCEATKLVCEATFIAITNTHIYT